MSIMGCSGDELGAILESLGFRREKRPVKRPAQQASDQKPANDNAEQAPPLDGVEAAAASQIATEPQASEEARVEAAPASESSGEDQASAEAPAIAAVEEGPAAAEVSAVARIPGEPARVTPDAASPQTANGPAAETAEPEFEEIWRFRRPKPSLIVRKAKVKGAIIAVQAVSGVVSAGIGLITTGTVSQMLRRRANSASRKESNRRIRRPPVSESRGKGITVPPMTGATSHRHHDGDRNRNRGRQPASQSAANPPCQNRRAPSGRLRAVSSSTPGRRIRAATSARMIATATRGPRAREANSLSRQAPRPSVRLVASTRIRLSRPSASSRSGSKNSYRHRTRI